MTLADLKVGDKAVIRRDGSLCDSRSIVTITKAHKLHLWTSENETTKWRRDDGRPVGASGWHIPRLLPGTPELLLEVRTANRKARLARTLRDTDWGKLDLPVLEQIAALLPPPEPPVLPSI